MRLSDLNTGEHGIIVKILGHGGFRKRIVEMGFIRGKKVKAILNAPLKDPVEYEIMGYKISLRREEANLIEIISEEEVKQNNTPKQLPGLIPSESDNEENNWLEKHMNDLAIKRRHIINVALVGNPNCGKTSLFNIASGGHEHVGNYSGVTVDAKEGYFSFGRYRFKLIDLPGTYSLSAYSPEELYVRKNLLENPPDVVINVVDASNLERNLYLTTQLIDMNIRMVVALNMYDMLEKNGDHLDYKTLGILLGTPMIPTISRNGAGLEELFNTIIKVYESSCCDLKRKHVHHEKIKEKRRERRRHHHYAHLQNLNIDTTLYRHIHINHGAELEESINKIKKIFQKNQQIRYKYSTRYLAIKFLENDKEIEKIVQTLPNRDELISIRYQEQKRIKEELKDNSEAAIVDAKYGFIQGALLETYHRQTKKSKKQSFTERLDSIITNKWLGIPLFFLVLYIMFYCTYTIGQYPMDWIDWGVNALGNFVSFNMEEGMLKDMIIEGIIGGVGSVIVFLPNILILYLFISFLEDTGYMSRAAFIMDRLMHKMGLHGKSFIPMVMGFGCNVPAIMATRTIESRKSRLITMLVIPFMSCSARLPIYIILAGAFFADYAATILLFLYLLGIIVAIISAQILSKFIIRGEDLPFVMELPPYHIPTFRSVTKHTWEKGRQYLRKMGGIILFFSIIIWCLGYFPRPHTSMTKQQEQEQSYIGQIGKTIEPIFAPLGFDWKMDIGIISGIGAKELVVSTLGVIYNNNIENESEETANTRLQQSLITHIQPAVALAYLVFILIYFPCIASIVAIKQESGAWKWALFSVFYTTFVAWILAYATYHIALPYL